MAPEFVERWRRRNWTPARTAAVERLSPMRARSFRRQRRPEQERASFFARKLGLIRFAVGLLADSAARCSIQVEKQKIPGDKASWEPTTEGLFGELIDRYRNTTEDSRELIRQRVWHDQVTGDCVQCVDTDETGQPQFKVRSSLLADFSGARILVREMRGGMPSDGSAKWYNPEQVWYYHNPDEEEPRLARSPLMGVLEDCERLYSLLRDVKHRTDSAIAMNKMIWYPNEMDTSMGLAARQPGGVNQPGSSIEADYYELAQLSLEDEDEIAGYAPFLVHGPHQYGAPQLVDIGNSLDPNGLAYREAAVADIARGLNYPQRLLVSGVGEGNHWSDWLLQPEFVRSTLAPVLERVLWGDLTRGFLRPALNTLHARGMFADDPHRYRIGFDPTPVIVRPDQSARSIELYKLGIVGSDTVLKLNGFDRSDQASQEEIDQYVKIMQAIAGAEGAPPGGGTAPPGGAPSDPLGKAEPPALAAVAPVRPFPAELVGWLDEE